MHNVKSAAARLGVSPSLIYSLIAARELGHVRVGFGRGVIRIPEQAIVDYENRRSVTIAGAPPAPAPRRKPKLKHLEL